MSQGYRGFRGWGGLVSRGVKAPPGGPGFWELPVGLASERHAHLSIPITKTISGDIYAGSASALIRPIREIRDKLGTLWPDSGTRRDKLLDGVQ
jgi:hypothetical protein